MSSVRRFVRSFTVRCSAQRAYAHWRDHATLAADFPAGVHAIMYGSRTRWRANCGSEVYIWETVCTADVPGRLLAWTTVSTEAARHSWDLWFAERADGWGTDIELVVILEHDGPDTPDNSETPTPPIGNPSNTLHLEGTGGGVPADPEVVCSDPLLDPDPEYALDQLVLLWQARLAQPH